MILNVNATKMELTRLKKEYSVAISGHKLMSDKRDALMRDFIEISKKAKRLRISLEKETREALIYLAFAAAAIGKEKFENAFTDTSTPQRIETTEKSMMSVKIPVFNLINGDKSEALPDFSLDDFKSGIEVILKNKENYIKLAELETAVKILAAELSKTRRRVNSLEHVLIPNYRDTIKFINMKMEENSRSNTARLLKVKDLILENKYKK